MDQNPAASQNNQLSYNFLAGGGEMGQRIRDYDWSSTELGSPEQWPQSLKTSVRLLLSTGHPMFIWWGPNLIQFYNDAYRRSIGSERHPSALGQQGRECWAEAWSIIGPQIEYVMAGAGFTWNENQLVPFTRNGKRDDIYWTYSYTPIDDPEATNGVGGVLVVCTETTAQVLEEQRRKHAEARWRDLFMQAPGFMCILNGPEHRFEFANPRYFDLVGHRDLIGRTVAEAFPELEQQSFRQLLDETYQSGSAFSGTAIPITLIEPQSGEIKKLYLDFVYQPIINATGEVTGIFVEGFDVSDRERYDQKLRAEDRRKDEFLAMLAHELRNPLAPIRNAGKLLTQSSLEATDVQKIGELVTRQANQLTHLVDDLLDVSRITQGRIELQRQTLELDSVIRYAIESVQPLMQEKRHELIYQPKDADLFIAGDSTRISQCIVNVLTNAGKYTDHGGRIDIALTRSDNEAMIEISDNGTGIAPETLPNVFELFVQADRALDRAHGGLGIGLSIVQRLVQMHGGTISARSDGLGKGSSFQIRLPLVATPEAIAPATMEPFLLRPMQLLIVDDNKDAADSLAQLLRLKGHETATAYSANDALSFAQSKRADIILLDIGLPEIDGYEVARRIRAERHDCILIALTGYGQADDIQRAKEAGFNNHMTKPVALEDLELLLQSYA